MGRTAVLVCAALLVGCGASYDEDGFDQVTAWAEAQIVAVDSLTITDLDDPTQRADLADRLDANNAMPLPDDMSGWLINRSQGNRTWTVEGDQLGPAVEDLKLTSGWLADELRGDNDRELGYAIEDAIESADDLRSILTGR